MILTASCVVPYLVARGWKDSVGPHQIVELGGRHRSFRVVGRDGAGLFVKQVRHAHPYLVSSLAREAACYALASAVDTVSPGRLMPKFLDYDAVWNVLTVALLPGETVWQFHAREFGFPLWLAAAQARALASIHSDSGLRFTREATATGLSRSTPAGLSIHLDGESVLQPLSAANATLLAGLRQSPDVIGRLDSLRRQWRAESLMHGDVRWENMLISAHESAPSLRLVDWELAELGDAGWDVAGVLASYLACGIMRGYFDARRRCGFLATGMAWRTIWPALGEFWWTYIRCRRLAREPARELLMRATGYAGARLIQTAFEQSFDAIRVDAAAIELCRVGWYALHDPGGAIDRWFGMRRGTGVSSN